MEVSMDGLRWQLLNNYNSLTRKLNRGIDGDETTVDVRDITQNMDSIRNCIVTLAYMYDNSEDGFKILENPTFETFNSNDEE